MEVIKRKLDEISGSVTILTAVLVLIILMLFALVWEYINLFTITQSVRDFGTQAVVAVAANNSYSAFVGVKESNTYSATIDTQDVQNRLQELLKLSSNMEKHVNGKHKFTLKNLEVQFENATISADGNEVTLNFVTTLTLVVPMRFGTQILPPMVKEMRFESRYVPMFA